MKRHMGTTIDHKAGVIRHLKIFDCASLADRRSAKAAIPQYQGAQVAAGFGWLEAVVCEADGLYGDLHYLTSHHLTPQVLELVSRSPFDLAIGRANRGGFALVTRQKDVLESRKENNVSKKVKPAVTRRALPGNSDAGHGSTISGSDLWGYFIAKVKSIFCNQTLSGPDRASRITKAAKAILAAEASLPATTVSESVHQDLWQRAISTGLDARAPSRAANRVRRPGSPSVDVLEARGGRSHRSPGTSAEHLRNVVAKADPAVTRDTAVCFSLQASTARDTSI